MKKGFAWALMFMAIFISFDLFNTSNAYGSRIKYLAKWDATPVPYNLKLVGKQTKVPVYSSNGKIKKYYVERYGEVNDFNGDHFFTRKAKINGRVYYKAVYENPYHINPLKFTYYGWIKSQNVNKKVTSYFGPLYATSFADNGFISGYSENKAPYFGLYGLPKQWTDNISDTVAGFRQFNELDVTFRTTQENDSIGLLICRGTAHTIIISGYGQKHHGKSTAINSDIVVRSGKTRSFRLWDNVNKWITGEVSNNRDGHWLTYKYQFRHANHIVTVDNTGKFVFAGVTTHYGLSSVVDSKDVPNN